MKVSFIVAVYCVEKYIGQCIESLQNQDGMRDIEIILVDDGSQDRSGEICDSYAQQDSRIKVIHQENQGVSAARNAGMEAAKGEWVCFVDGDDAVVPNLCQMFEPYLTEETDVCFFDHEEVQDQVFPSIISTIISGKKIVFFRSDFEEFTCAAFNRDYPGKYDYHKVKLSTPCKFYRRKFLMEYRIQFPKGVPTGEDCLFNLEVYKYASRGVYLDSKFYLHRVWGNSVSKKYNPGAVTDFELLHSKMQQFIDHEDKLEKYMEVYAQRCIWSLGFCCLLDFCHPENPKTYVARKRDFLDACKSDMGKQAGKAALDTFRFEKRVLFWMIQRRWFWAVDLLCRLKRRFGKD